MRYDLGVEQSSEETQKNAAAVGRPGPSAPRDLTKVAYLAYQLVGGLLSREECGRPLPTF
jgi:hypothetical protein